MHILQQQQWQQQVNDLKKENKLTFVNDFLVLSSNFKKFIFSFLYSSNMESGISTGFPIN